MPRELNTPLTVDAPWTFRIKTLRSGEHPFMRTVMARTWFQARADAAVSLDTSPEDLVLVDSPFDKVTHG